MSISQKIFAYWYCVAYVCVIVATFISGSYFCAVMFSIMAAREFIVQGMNFYYAKIAKYDEHYKGNSLKTWYVILQIGVEFGQFSIIFFYAWIWREADLVLEIIYRVFLLFTTFQQFKSLLCNKNHPYEPADHNYTPKTFKGRIKSKVRELDLVKLVLTGGLLINMIYNNFPQVKLYETLVVGIFLLFYALTRYVLIVNPGESSPWRFSAPVWITLLLAVNILHVMNVL